MKQKIPVQWLVEEITNKYDKSFIEFYRTEIDQALKMERKQIEHAYDFGNSRVGLSTYGIADGSDYYSNLYDTEE